MGLAERHLQPKLDLGKSTWPFRSQVPAYNVVLLSLRHRDAEKAKAFYLKHEHLQIKLINISTLIWRFQRAFEVGIS